MTKTVMMSSPLGAGPKEAAREKAQALVGSVIAERYKIEAVLAASEVAAVYRAQHVRLRKRMALKVLHAGAPDAELARLEREAVAGAHVQHQNVVGATDSGELPDGARYLAIEHVPGTTLREVLQNGPLAPPRALRIARQIAAALGAVHERGIVHRAVEPRNVMLTGATGDEAKLIDFGRAKMDVNRFSADASVAGVSDDLTNAAPMLTATGVVEATSAYLPPEAALGSTILDARGDLYSLGVVLYEMLAGKRPFDAEVPKDLFAAQREKDIPPIAERAPGVQVAPQVEGVLQHLLNKDRTARYPNAAAALVAIESASRAMPDVAPEPGEADLIDVQPAGLPTLVGRHAAAGGSVIGRALRAASDALADGWDALLGKLGKAPPKRASVAARGTPIIEQPRRSPIVPAAIGGSLLLLVVVIVVAARGDDETSPAATDGSGRTTAVVAPTGSSTPSVTHEEGPATVDGKDAAAWKTQLANTVQAQQWPRAAKAVEALAEIDQAAFKDPTVVGQVMSAAVALETVGGRDADMVFNALGARLGTRGLEILFEIVRTKGGTKGAQRAAQILNEPDVVPLEPPALRVAFELTEAPCQDKPALFERAAEEGDERALTQLRMLKEIECRKKEPCCFRDNKELVTAIARLRERLGLPDPAKKPKDD